MVINLFGNNERKYRKHTFNETASAEASTGHRSPADAVTCPKCSFTCPVPLGQRRGHRPRVSTRPWRSLAQRWGVTGRGLARGIRRGLPSRARAAPPDAGCSARAPGLAGHALSRRQCRSQEEDVTSQVRKPVLRDAVSCLREESSEF